MKPEETYQQYLADKTSTQPEEYTDMLRTGNIDEHFTNKINLLTHIFNFNEATSILDVGSSGFFTSLLMRDRPGIKRATVIDGNKEQMQSIQPYIDKRITQVYHNFYQQSFPNISHHHLALHIDFAEHLPDDLYTEILHWTMERAQGVYIYTPEYPNCADQYEHISVKTQTYFHSILGRYQYKIFAVRGRLFIVANNR